MQSRGHASLYTYNLHIDHIHTTALYVITNQNANQPIKINISK